MGRGGNVDDRTVAEAADGVRRILVAIDAGELACSAGYRNRLQGAVVALEANSLGLRPPLRPRARAASRPSRVRSEIRDASNSKVARTWKNMRPAGVVLMP